MKAERVQTRLRALRDRSPKTKPSALPFRPLGPRSWPGRWTFACPGRKAWLAAPMTTRPDVVEVLLADGWHNAVPGTFELVGLAGHTEAGFVFLEGVEVHDGPVLNPTRVSGPRTSLLAIRERVR